MVLILSGQEVEQVIDIKALIDGVQGTLVALSKGLSINPNRLRIFVQEEKSMLACMPAYLGDIGVLGAKIVGSSGKPQPPGSPRQVAAIVVLLDSQGKFLSVMSGALLGPLRTAATSAVATNCLSRPDASTMAMIGCGVQARVEIQGTLAVRPITQVFAYDINELAAARFAQEITERHGIKVSVAKSSDQAVAEADIVTLATTSAEPVFSASALRAGTHINAVGAHTPQSREMDSDTIVRSKFFVESRQAILSEAGDILIPIKEGRVDESHVLGEIGEVIAGTAAGRMNAEDVTIFKSTGIAVEDVVAAKIVYDAALAKGIGYQLEL
ncbi:ornithine cyclodeaminase family protein [Paraburkholderia aspalathi]|jgi:alanine dehydrogenase|uniref:ornithine cyclodeaminase family protein n=1 Tax=Paraburkholderia aspalathi TaxID=1324617 RepID=UPI001B1D4091|nr:ornithine cyclodeaminase family protein [Paraburkholderia aspalathi]CAE6737905.1 Delta(1)-pyrroline-2-carboxylate reductase [Paraburkholderia aspalathi]